ncbi:AsmA family protein [Burkholderiaceae bacterium DAT-1]|nr:AsmA family protein [Burkholderiaceae bacterium DAT-1]
MPIKELPTRVRRTVYGVATSLALVAALPLFNFSMLCDRIERDTADSLGRKLEIGAVRLALLPRPAVTLEEVHMLEADGKREFARFRSARFSLDWAALLEGRVKPVDARVEGLKATVAVMPDGRLSFEDLLTHQPQTDRLVWQLNRIDLVDSALDWHDQGLQPMHFTRVEMHVIQPESDDGRVDIEGRVEAPGWAGALKVQSGLRFNRSRLTADMKGFGLSINANTPEWRDAHLDLKGNLTATAVAPIRTALHDVKAQFNVKHGDQLWRAGFTTPEMLAAVTGLSTGVLQGQISIKGTDREMAADLDVEKLAAEAGSGNLVADRAAIKLRLMDNLQNATLDVQSPLRLDSWHKATLEGFTLGGSYRHVNLPGGAIKVGLNGRLAIDLDRERVDFDSSGTLDQSPLTAKVSLENFVDTRYALGISLARLDLTPYLQAAPATPGAPVPAVSPAVMTDLASKPIDWRWLDKLHARGDVRLDELDVGRFRMFNLNTHFEASDRKLTLDPLAADIYGGRMGGRLVVDSGGGESRAMLKQKLSGMEVEALLSDTVGLNGVAGRGDIDIELNTAAGSLNEARRKLAGNATFKLSHGTFTGFDITDFLRGVSLNLAKLTGEPIKADVGRRTKFSELNAAFNIKDGIANTTNLRMTAPLLTVDGSGQLDLAKGEVDYLLNVSPAGGSGVAKLDALKGTLIPISFRGALASPSIGVDTTAIKAKLAAPTTKK